VPAPRPFVAASMVPAVILEKMMRIHGWINDGRIGNRRG
jgi:hypothetical protein